MERRELTPDCQPIATLLAAQRPEVRELVCYLLVMSLVDAHKAKIKSAQVVNRQHYLTIEPVSGSRFAVRRPPISMAAELRLREEVMRVLEEEEARRETEPAVQLEPPERRREVVHTWRTHDP